MLSLYDEHRHGHLVSVLNHDPKAVALLYTAQVTWMLGYPDQAVRISDNTDAHARLLGHPFNLGFVLSAGARVFDHLGKPDEFLTRAERNRAPGS